jgi:hypothetical protein
MTRRPTPRFLPGTRCGLGGALRVSVAHRVFTMQRGADGSAITHVATWPKTLTLSPNLSDMFSGARERVSSPAAAPYMKTMTPSSHINLIGACGKVEGGVAL